YGELPEPGKLKEFSDKLRENADIPNDMGTLIDALPRNGHPMALMSSMVNTLAGYYEDSADPGDEEQIELATIRLMAKLPTIAARDRKSTRLNSSHVSISYAVFCLK